jgi:hypothetical protein
MQLNHDKLTASEFQLMFNRCDNQITEFMLGYEKK